MMRFLSGLADPLSGESAEPPLQHPDTQSSLVQQNVVQHPKSLMERMVSDLQSDPVSSASNVIPPDSLETGLFASMAETNSKVTSNKHRHKRLRGWKRGWAWGTPPWAKERGHGFSAKKKVEAEVAKPKKFLAN